jgi:protein TonB
MDRKSTRPSVSAKRITDIFDMARPQGRGANTGRGQGTLFPRRGSPNGTKNGKPVWLSTSDRRYVDYFRGIYRKVNPLWLFPKELEIMMEQGNVLIQFTILKDGTVKNVRIRKSSGYPKFDQNVVVAILKAAPFKPIPNGLGQRLDILAPFEFSNPMVQ